MTWEIFIKSALSIAISLLARTFPHLFARDTTNSVATDFSHRVNPKYPYNVVSSCKSLSSYSFYPNVSVGTRNR